MAARNGDATGVGLGPMRSLLFAPAHSPREIAAALACGADAVILDLDGSAAGEARARARQRAAQALAGRAAGSGGPRLIVRIGRLDSGLADEDLDAVCPHAPDAIMLPGARGGEDVQHLSVKIAVREAQAGLPEGLIGALPLTESAAAIFRLGTHAGASARLRGLAWDAENLAADIGATAGRTPEGAFTPPVSLARSLTLFAAAAAGAPAIDCVFADWRDAEGLARECALARRDGFSGKLAVHPDQAATINAAFGPPPEQGE